MVLPLALPPIATAVSTIIGGLLGTKAEKKQIALQREFAQNAIQWKVQDANKAGIHPLFALGAPTTSYQPISTGSMANAVSGMGQDLGRAMDAVRNPEQRASAAISKMEALQLERAGLENTLLRTQIVRETSVPGQPPAMPGGATEPLVPGQGDTRQIELRLPTRTPHLKVGLPYNTNPNFVDADAITQRYGESEILEMLTALINGGADAFHNIPFIKSVKPFRGTRTMQPTHAKFGRR